MIFCEIMGGSNMSTSICMRPTSRNYNINVKTFRFKKSYIATLISSITIMIIIFCSCLIIANAGVTTSNKAKEYKYYTSITIQKGDTLWSIANNYSNNSESISNYINNIKQINKLTTDNIIEGQSIIVYYYSTDYK